MQIAIVLFPDFTAMDVIGPYEVLGRIPGAELVFVAEQPGLIVSDMGSLSIAVTASLDDVPSPDVVLIGGGPGQLAQMTDGPLHRWLRSVDQTCTWMTSVCTGSQILAAAGLLKGREATTHWGALEELRSYDVTPSDKRVVVDGHYVTGAGVSAGIDMAFVLTSLIADEETAHALQLILEYAPEPPFDVEHGSALTAPRQVMERVMAWACEMS